MRQLQAHTAATALLYPASSCNTPVTVFGIDDLSLCHADPNTAVDANLPSHL